jgi:inner membrane protein involved in colicin E2 resistance
VNIAAARTKDAAVIKVTYTIIPLMSVPVIFMTAKDALLEMVFEKTLDHPETPQQQYYVCSLLLLVLFVVVACLLDHVGFAYSFIGSCATMLNA